MLLVSDHFRTIEKLPVGTVRECGVSAPPPPAASVGGAATGAKPLGATPGIMPGAGAGAMSGAMIGAISAHQKVYAVSRHVRVRKQGQHNLGHKTL